MTSKERHTIAIIDDHPLFRRGVRELLDLEQGLDLISVDMSCKALAD